MRKNWAGCWRFSLFLLARGRRRSPKILQMLQSSLTRQNELSVKPISLWNGFEMFEDYLQDSYEFLALADTSADDGSDREARRYYRAGLEFALGETLRYQYMLQGADAGWSAPALQRSVHYANLAPASYRFLVRAINSEGVASPQPASISFLILPPVWLRWWFQLLAVAVVAAAVYRLHRYRSEEHT